MTEKSFTSFARTHNTQIFFVPTLYFIVFNSQYKRNFSRLIYIGNNSIDNLQNNAEEYCD